MRSLSFVPLSLADGYARARGRAVVPAPAIVFGREAVFVDLPEEAEAAEARLPGRRRVLQAGKVVAAVVQRGACSSGRIPT